MRGLGIAQDCIFRDASLRDNLRLHVRHVNGGAHALQLVCKPGRCRWCSLP